MKFLNIKKPKIIIFLLSIGALVLQGFFISINSTNLLAQNFDCTNTALGYSCPGKSGTGYACGITQPDAQFWLNCNSANPTPGCRTDPTQRGSVGWEGEYNGVQQLVTSPANPVWINIQCFERLSLGGLGAFMPAKIEFVTDWGGGFRRSMIKSSSTESLLVQVPDPGTYKAICYTVTANNYYGCTASYDTITIGSRVSCTPSTLSAGTLILPLNDAEITLDSQNGVDFSYDVNSMSWGNGCPNRNTYSLQIRPDCSGGYIDYGPVTKVNGLDANRTYCWRVIRQNGTFFRVTSARTFRTLPAVQEEEVTSAGIVADVCSAGFSGISGVAGVTNPIDFNLNFSKGTSNTFREVWLAAVPDNTAFNQACPALGGGSTIDNNVCQNMESLDVQTESIILQKAKNSNSFVAKLILDSGGNVVESRMYNGTSWNTQTINGGAVSGMGATLLDYKTNSIASVSGNNLSSNFRIRYDSTPYGKYAFYVATLVADSSNNLKTSYATPGNNLVFKRVNASASRTNWGVDLVAPSTTTAFSTVNFTGANTFNVNWNIQESNGLTFKSFASRDIAESALTDSTSGSINFATPIPNVASYENGSLQYGSIGSGNAFVSTSPTLRSYTDADPSKQVTYQFYAFARDAACNQKVVTTTSNVQKPWLTAYNGSISAKGGFVGISIPQGLTQFSADLRSASDVILPDRQSVFLSTYSAISGNSSFLNRKQSKLIQYNINYNDLAVKPPLNPGYSNWFDHTYETVKKNNVAPIQSRSGNIVLSGTTASFLGVSADTRQHVFINGTLTVNANSVCNTKTIFFVKDSSNIVIDSTYTNADLKIIPDLRVSGNNNGCLFIVATDVLIDNGAKVSNKAVTDSNLSNYDLIEAAIITDAKFITKSDITNTANKGDGLTIKGSVTSIDLTLQRDINLNANQSQPAHLFYFDPRYREIFKNDLHINKYSIREVGYSSE